MRVEELEQRLKWTEDQLKRALESRQVDGDVDPAPQTIGFETSSSNHSRADTAHLSLSISENNSVNAILPISGVTDSTLNISLPFQQGNYKSGV